MADRYWVGVTTAAWNVITSWSATSGGLPGASVPTTTDNAIFDRATTYTVTCTGNLSLINFTVSAGTVTFTSTGTLTVSGNFSLSTGTVWSATGLITFTGTSARTITTSATSISASITFSGVSGVFQLQDALTISSTQTATLSNGTLDLNNKILTTGFFNSTTATTRTIAFGSGNITCLGAGGTLCNLGGITGLTFTGTPIINISYTGSVATSVITAAYTEANNISFNFTAGTYALNFPGTNSNTARNINFTGFSGTWSGRSYNITLYGSMTLSSGMSFGASTGFINFASTSGVTQTITTAAKPIASALFFQGASSGGVYRLEDALTMPSGAGSTRSLTLSTATLDLNGKTLTVGSSFVTGAGTKNLTFNGGTLSCIGAGGFNNAAPAGFTTTAGTGTGKISMIGGQNFVGGGSTFNCGLSIDGSSGGLTITGANTFYSLGATVTSTMTLPISTTTTITTTPAITGTPTATLTLTSATSGTTTTINYTGTGTPRGNYMALRDLIFTPNTATSNGSTPYTWYVGGNSTNNGRVSGAAFVTYPQVVYYISDTAVTSWTTPPDWNPSNNAIYLVGAGGGGAAAAYFSSSSKAGGSGGGGGGYTQVSNYLIGASTAISSISIGVGGAAGSTAVATSSTGGTGGSTTIPNPSGGTYSAGGGTGASSSATASVRTATPGTGGTGTNFNGGNGGTAATTTTTNGISGSGGGGAGGPNGNGAIGGNGGSSVGGSSGGGGGGNGGGANGSTSGGNNSQGFGGGAVGATNAPGTAGFAGGGGGGGGAGPLGTGASGGAGIDILKTIGGAGGAGGGSSSAAGNFPGVGGSSILGGGGGGGGITSATRVAPGAGGSGLIVITYTPSTGATGNFFFMF